MKKFVLVFTLIATFCLVGAIAPEIIGISIDRGIHGMSYSISIIGNNFIATPTADFGIGINTTAVNYFGLSIIVADIDVTFGAPLGFHDMIVTNPSGEADTLLDAFEVLPEDDPPEVYLIHPDTCGGYFGCLDRPIEIKLVDGSGIDDTLLQVRMNGIIYTIDSIQIALLGDTVLYFIPRDSYFTDGDIFDFAIVRIADTFGNVSILPFDCTFIVDRQAPFVLTSEPPIDGFTRDEVPDFQIWLVDSGAGIDSSGFEFLIIRNSLSETLAYDITDASLYFRRDTLVWRGWMTDFIFEDGETIMVCIHATDLVPGGACGPNEMDTCWPLRYVFIPPILIDLTIDRIYTDKFPMVTGHCLVLDEFSNTVEHLDASNFTVWEDHGIGWKEQYPLIVQPLGGSGMIDIVFCIDTTGSMHGMISSVEAGLVAFADSLIVAGISPRLGLNTFGDGVNFTYGYELTGAILTFRARVASIGAGGGADGEEESLDAIMMALDSMNFRSGAHIVIVMITDARACTLGEPPPYSLCNSDYTLSMVESNLLMNRADLFVVANSRLDMGYPGWEAIYTDLCESTPSGRFFSWDSSFTMILSYISEAVRGGYIISWTSSHPFADCQMRNVKIRVDAYGLDDTRTKGYLAPCSPTTAILEPLPDTWTSDSIQRILMTFDELEAEDSIDETSIVFMVKRKPFNIYDPVMNYTDPILTWTPNQAFTNNEVVDVELSRVMDLQGNLPFAGPVRWKFRVDLEPPRVTYKKPDNGDYVITHTPKICFKIWDEESGLNKEGLLIAVDNKLSRQQFPPFIVTFTYNSDGVSWDGRYLCWDPIEAGISFMDRDTVCVNILRAVDQPDYGDPNVLEDRWCFIIPDDDTLCPEFSDLSPDSTIPLSPLNPFDIQANIVDETGVYNAWVEWDIDGDLDDGTFSITDMQELTDDIFKTINSIPGQREVIDFVYRICACDNDTDHGDFTDSSCCCSDIMPLYFGQGPAAEPIEPINSTVSTNEDQRIVVRIYDDESGVDPSTIILRINSIDYHFGGPDMVFSGETLYYYPQPGNYFTDGEDVDVEIVQAKDKAGNDLRGVYRWSFFVDLTPPVVTKHDPARRQLIMDSQYTLKFEIVDRWREVDPLTLELFIYNRILHPTGDVGWTYTVDSSGLNWDERNHSLKFVPIDAVPQFAYPNNDTVCIRLLAADLMPDYGLRNFMDPFNLCFLFAVSGCDAEPLIVTPNGDGFNDMVYFTYPDMVKGIGIIYIYDTEGELIWESPKGADTWSCVSGSGELVRPGLYIYVIEVGGEVKCTGSITVAR